MRGVVLGVLMMGGCASTLPIPVTIPQVDEAAYTAEHPLYLEFCALSEIQKHPGHGADIRGGFGGHSTIYLNGVCRTGDGYPEIALCGASDGVGLSVNAHFANANWVPIPGRDFFYHGDLKPGQGLTEQVYAATKAHAKSLGVYDAIRFHDRVFADMPADTAREDFKYEVSIATDYAINYGRDRYCARVPVFRPQMTRIVAYLNGLNRPYRDGPAEYEWSVLTDNCIHVAHNALAAIGFWPVWPTHRPVLIAAFDFPVPKNEFVNIMRTANDMPIGDLRTLWRDVAARQALLAGDSLPTRPGALATFEPVVQQNDLYTTDLQLIFYDEPMFGPYERWFHQIVAYPRYTGLAANRHHFNGIYARIHADRQPLDWWRQNHPGMTSDRDFPVFYDRYYDAIDRAGG